MDFYKNLYRSQNSAAEKDILQFLHSLSFPKIDSTTQSKLHAEITFEEVVSAIDTGAWSSYYFCTLLVVVCIILHRFCTRKCCERRQKRGKRLKTSPFKPPLLTIFLSNARSIRHKLDEIRLQIATRRTTTVRVRFSLRTG